MRNLEAVATLGANRLAEARALFPAAERWVYANIASRGILPRQAREAIDRIADGQFTGDAEKADWQGALDGARAGVASLIGARGEDEVAVTRNVSDGLNIVANGLGLGAGDNVVMCCDLEHPNMVFTFANLARHGVEIRDVPAVDGCISPAAVAAAIDGRTKVVAASTVTFTPGSRTDCAAIGALCRREGIFFLVDAVQSLGVLRTGVAEEAIDGLSTSTSKGLLGAIGLGFLYVRREWAERINPAYLARFSVSDDGGHESERSGSFRLKPGALRFETGNYNWIGLAAAAASLTLIREVGPQEIEAHALRLARDLRGGLEARGYPVYRPQEAAAESHIVTVGRMGEGDAYTTADARLETFAGNLRRQDVKFSIRRGQVRFGFHLYNADSDVAAILGCAA